jgi:peptidoglycan hydrolase-like protein with peptidoglycan-binding domain
MVIERGDTGPEVARIQRALQQAGFNVDDDGDFGRDTEEAVERFQRDQGLDVDGEVGPDTLEALGLGEGDTGGDGDGGTDGGSDPADTTDIVFDVSETEIRQEVQRRIEDLVGTLASTFDHVLDSAQLAIDQFETTMQFGSNDSEANVPGSLLAEVLRAAAEQLARRVSLLVPGLDDAFGFGGGLIETVVGELAESGQAAAGSAAGRWIKGQREVLDRARRDLVPRRLGELTFEIENAFLESDDKPTVFDGLVDANDRLADEALPDVSEFEAQLYERWINEHFRDIGDDTEGCIEFRYEYDDNTFDFVSCTVAAPFGSQIEDGFNRLFDERLVPRAPRPFELLVRKRACFLVDNVNLGGKSWSCGWLDAKGNIIHRPVHDPAERALAEPIWRHQNRFVR